MDSELANPLSSSNHWGLVKWCSVTNGLMPRSCSALSICRYLASADSSQWPSLGSMRLHSTESLRAFTPRDWARSKSFSALRHQSHANPTQSLDLIRPFLSHSVHWLFAFSPST